MIGSRQIGWMGDNDVEGWGGYRIDQVSVKAENSLPYLPNVVCILAGANDVYQRHDTDNMSLRMGQLIDKIFAAVPDTTIILSTLPPNDDPTDYAIMKVFNKNLTDVVARRASNGSKIHLVDCSSSVGFQRDSLASLYCCHYYHWISTNVACSGSPLLISQTTIILTTLGTSKCLAFSTMVSSP
jgi:hypothetical protein